MADDTQHKDYQDSPSYQLGYACAFIEDICSATSWRQIQRYQEQGRAFLKREEQRRARNRVRIAELRSLERE
jgi:hypothetical protein